MKPIPLFGTGIRSFSRAVTAQRRLNCHYDIRQDGDKAQIIIRGTPGCFVWTTIPQTPIRGWRVVNTLLYVVAGTGVYQVDFGGNVTLLGSIGSDGGRYVGMYDDSVSMVIVDGVSGYNMTLPSGVPTLISDPNFPVGATSVTALDSRFIAPVPNTRQFRISELLGGAIWTPEIFGTKENYSSLLQAVDVLNGNILLWGLTDMEFWQNVGSSPNPYQRINGATQTWGLAALYSRAYLGNTMVFLGQNPNGGVQVMYFKGYSPERISNSDLEDIITNFPVYNDAIALTYMSAGHPMYQLTFPAANRSFLYDFNTTIWSEAQTGVALLARHMGNLGIVYNTKNYICDSQSGAIYQLDSNTFTDNGTAIKRQVASRHIRLDGNGLGIDEIILEMETGVGLNTGQGENPQIMMQVSKDNGQTFGVERWKSIGRQAHYKRRLVWDSLGDSRDFVFQWTMTDPVKFIITNGEATLSPGTESMQ